MARSISPLAMLEVFEGSKHALNAPEWTQWNRPTLQFQQPHASFAALFAWMAQWDVNQSNVSILYLDLNIMANQILKTFQSYQMTMWAQSIWVRVVIEIAKSS